MGRVLSLIILFLMGAVQLFAQTGEIQGKVTDGKTGESIPFANVAITVNGTLTGAQTDFDGFYSVKPVPPGSYQVQVSFVGYQKKVIEGVLIAADEITFLDVQLAEESEMLEAFVVEDYKVPLLKKDETSTGSTVTKEDIQNLPTRNVSSIAAQSSGVFQSDEGGSLNVKGSRSEATEYYIDGIKVRGSSNLPASAIEQMSVVTGGVAARYGDATGGIINITTRGASPTFGGGVELITSRFLDPYNYNLANASLTGPILKRKSSEGAVRTIMGFFVSGEYRYEGDYDPSAIGVWNVKDDVMQNIRENPLVKTESSTGFLKAVDFITKDDLQLDKTKPNAHRTVGSLAGKIDIQPVSNINLTVGGSLNYEDRGSVTNFSRRYQLYDSEHRPWVTDLDYRFYGRFLQRFGTQKSADADKQSASLLSNAYYQVQFDYSRARRTIQDLAFEDRVFEYGHVGMFDVGRVPVYSRGEVGSISGWQFDGFRETSVDFTPGTVNQEKINHNNQYFSLANAAQTSSLDQILLNGGLLNGSVPSSLSSAYNLWYTPGTPYSFFTKDEDDQYRLTFRTSFDLKKPGASEISKHAIEVGFEYEQRIDRYHSINGVRLWDVMDQLSSKFGQAIVRDLDNPYLIIDGQRIPFSEYDGKDSPIFSVHDTIDYDLIHLPDEQSYFDRNMREKFGIGNTEIIEPFSYSPDQFSLDMLSADELLNNGSELVTYYGYDYLGNKLTNEPAFEDFWTAYDEEKGIYTRPIGAFRPIYMAGYIQDKFSFKDLIFNVGVRVDRFDANQKVPKDQFVPLHATRKAGDVNEIGGNAVTHPTTIGKDFVVYVDDEINPGAILGYRNETQWYSAGGVAINDPDVLLEGGAIKPYLASALDDSPTDDVKDTAYDPSLSFEDYEPQVTVMPRIAFSFSISEEAIFFAHYDVLSQRPRDRITSTPEDYYFLAENSTLAQNNPNLRPERTTDYQIGFKQKLTNSSSLSLSGFYREIKDLIQIVNVPFAYPNSYSTYGNIDFGTVKGMEIAYDLRRTGNVRLTANYTLQFADGTGSGDRSQVDLVDFGQPNLRTIFPLTYDARHLINVNFDFRFRGGKAYDGPVLFGQNILGRTGLNLILNGSSGTPYSRQDNPTPEGQFGVRSSSNLEGTVNGSRLPWNYRLDARLDKDIKMPFGDDNFLNVYMLFQNLLNTRNVLSVYGFTGSPSDDGFVTSGQGQEVVEVQTDIPGFLDQYAIKVNNPNNFSIPRRIRLGVIMNF